jgi:hypothetical protein
VRCARVSAPVAISSGALHRDVAQRGSSFFGGTDHADAGVLAAAPQRRQSVKTTELIGLLDRGQQRDCRMGISEVSVGNSIGLREPMNIARSSPEGRSACVDQSTGNSSCHGCVIG